MPEIIYTGCRICEAYCGMKVEVERNRVVGVGPDREHPVSCGYFCVKGKAALDLQEDPRRLRYPMERRNGHFERTTWDRAIGEIGDRLRALIKRHGPRSVAIYAGNPSAFSFSSSIFMVRFAQSIGTPNHFSALSLDCSNRNVVAEKMYGHELLVTIPDLENTKYALIFGSNPAVTTLCQYSTRPYGLRTLLDARERGAKFVLVDPRRTESASGADLHLPIRPGTDLYLVFGLLHVILRDGLEDREFLAKRATGVESLRELASAFPPERVEQATGIRCADVERLGREFASAESAVAVGHSGITMTREGTLSEWGIAALCAVTGNIGRPGGLWYNPGAVDLPKLYDLITPKTRARSRVRGFPAIASMLATCTLADDILMPGEGQVRALIVNAGNPVISAPQGNRLREALRRLDLLVVIDIFKHRTADDAHFLLPATTFLERDDLPLFSMNFQPVPFLQYLPRAVEPHYEEKEEWEIFKMLQQRIGVPILGSRLLDTVIRTAERLDRHLGLGGRLRFRPAWLYRIALLRGRIPFGRLARRPRGALLGEKEYDALLERCIRAKDGRVRIAPGSFVASLRKVVARRAEEDPEFPLRLIGKRSLPSMNSWMNSLAALARIKPSNAAEINRADAARLGIGEDDRVAVITKAGKIRIPALLSDNVAPGVVAVEHGWGEAACDPSEERGDVRGVNVNMLIDDQDVDSFSGIPRSNGTPCRLERAEPAAS